MADELPDEPPAPPGRYELPDQHAESRPGPHAPIPGAREPIADAASIGQRLAMARHLRRTAVHWESDPTWPPLRDALMADYADLLDRDTNSAAFLRGQIGPLLGILPAATDAERLDALMAWLSTKYPGFTWDRRQIDLYLLNKPY